MADIQLSSPEDTPPVHLPPHLRKPRLRRAELSEYLELKHGIRLAPTTLAKLAMVGGGPPFHRSVRTPLYPVLDADQWAAERLGKLVRSTSDTGGEAA